MSETNPQIEQQLDKLAEICCQQLEGGMTEPGLDGSAVDELLKSLLMSGYARKEAGHLQTEIERRVRIRCREPAMHRGGALSSISDQLQKKFQELERWESRQPSQSDGPKTANISSARDA